MNVSDAPAQPETVPPHPRVMVLSHYEASAILSGEQNNLDRPVCGVISIGGGVDRPCVGFETVDQRLRLVFDDVAADINDNDAGKPDDPNDIRNMVARFMARQKRAKAEAMGLRVQPPTREHAEKVIAFARQVAESRDADEGVVLCHCQAGVSRSAGAALLCLATWTGPGHERYCVEQVMRVRSFAIPHHDLVAFGDDLLDRGGRLVGALDKNLEW